MVSNLILKQLFAHYNHAHFAGEIPDIPVIWNTRTKRRAGSCHYTKSSIRLTPTRIELSAKVFAHNDFDMKKVQRTLIHEMVHAYLIHKHNEKGHTRNFQILMTMITGEQRNHRLHDYDLPDGNVAVICENCGELYRRYRMPKRRLANAYSCKTCGGDVRFERV